MTFFWGNVVMKSDEQVDLGYRYTPVLDLPASIPSEVAAGTFTHVLTLYTIDLW